MGALQSLVDWVYGFGSSASPFALLDPKIQLLVLGVLSAVVLYFFVRFKPSPWLGEVVGPTVDEDSPEGAIHWSRRPLTQRIVGLVPDIFLAVILLMSILLVVALAVGHPLLNGSAFVVPLQALSAFFVLIAAGRFWEMGRRAQLHVIDSPEDIVRMNAWWVSELGLRENTQLRIGGKLGQPQFGAFRVNQRLNRSEIAMPTPLRERLGLDLGIQKISVASNAGAGPWPYFAAAPLIAGLYFWPHASSPRPEITQAPGSVSCSAPQIVEKPVETIVEKQVPQIVEREICTLYFDLDKATLNEPAKRALDTVDGKSHEPGVYVGVVGHTDTTGSAAYNQDLSEARAKTAAQALEAHGIPVATAEGKGESHLAVPTPDETLEPRNRRTVITIDPSALSADIPTQ